MGKAPIALITVEGISFCMSDQSDNAVFVRGNLMVNYVPQTDKIWDYSLKFLELEVSQ